MGCMSIKNTIKFLTLGFLTLALMSCEIVRKESPIWHWTSSDEEAVNNETTATGPVPNWRHEPHHPQQLNNWQK